MDYYNSPTWNDRWIVEVATKGKRNGFYVEVGVGGGIIGSTTYVLEKELGWKGILIEPHSFLKKRLMVTRPNAVIIDECVGDREGTIDFIEFTTKGMRGFSGSPQLSSEGPYVWWSLPERQQTEYIEEPKKVTTLENVLRKNNAPKIIDYLSMDIEGAEYSALRNFPFEEFKFRAISTEQDTCRELLLSNGYIETQNPFCETDNEYYFLNLELK
jgi:FkbM family methyltransferase